MAPQPIEKARFGLGNSHVLKPNASVGQRGRNKEGSVLLLSTNNLRRELRPRQIFLFGIAVTP
jgi:hypothetical protein